MVATASSGCFVEFMSQGKRHLIQLQWSKYISQVRFSTGKSRDPLLYLALLVIFQRLYGVHKGYEQLI